MRITTKLRIAALTLAIIALAIGAGLYFSYTSLTEMQKKGRSVREIMDGFSDIRSLVRHYALYHEERPQQQFLLSYNEIKNLIATLTFTDRQKSQILQNMAQRGKTVEALFMKLVDNYKFHRTLRNITLLSQAEERLAGQILIQLHEAMSDASYLMGLIDADIESNQRRINILLVAFLAGAIIPMVLTILHLTEKITSSLARLQKGTEIIGEGNLNYRTGISSQDEIGKLSQAFDRMTEKLQATTVSRDALAAEVEERRRTETELKEQAVQLEAANKELESFSYSISHDLRAPLRAIDGYARMILRTYEDKFDADTTRKFNDIRSNAQMMGRLIDDLLAFFRLGRKPLSISMVNMYDLANDVWKELQVINRDRNMTLVLQNIPCAYGDRTLIKQVYVNLLSNAVKFTKSRDEARIEVGGHTEADEDIFYVRDNGIGFDMAYYDKLFGVFQRLHIIDEFKSTGVGLATVKRIIQRHGGRVWAEGKETEGATFYFTLPRKKNGC